MLASEETSHSSNWQLALGAAPARDQSWEALLGSRTARVI